ncbi:MAG: Coenzyme F420 hydrogenase/dehydrogenase, beta subunit C-terminal domain, partial [Bacteroidales bacterium]|nr:Coenzyme F420 hydrogenase/dehydrogenase, beta subunit C-terminal domain [Bacteroidales bacterium]
MIRIQDKKDCCGCTACVQICPKTCIRMVPDEEGFLYPSVEETVCIGCGLCEKVCPVMNRGEERIPVRTLAVKNKNEEIRFKSSSGGAFSALATRILDAGGVVFGAKFDEEWTVVHDYIESVDALYLFQGSKYVQSNIGNTFSLAETFLESGRKVLFSGTPCQIAGLKRFLRKDYDNLVTADVICHGVPSPMVWRDYLKDLITGNKLKGVSSLNDITGVSFRSKMTGWRKFSIVVTGNDKFRMAETIDKNIFMQGFLNNLYLRPSCYDCPSRKGRSGSDLSLGDFWGVDERYPDFVDDMGVGVIL